ncbi:hypothetical protein AX17_005972 [Amanita inopinata Kibby_2008]|nr:hypothetical protein AX17_005972 [Amanita inopinata Kibby_2008]
MQVATSSNLPAESPPPYEIAAHHNPSCLSFEQTLLSPLLEGTVVFASDPEENWGDRNPYAAYAAREETRRNCRRSDNDIGGFVL